MCARTQAHVARHDAGALNVSRMGEMGRMSLALLLADAAIGGASRGALLRVTTIPLRQWAILALSVFSSAFVAGAPQPPRVTTTCNHHV